MTPGWTDPDGDERDETPTERADRNWSELLQELRVTQTGSQILTGFLLTLPFQQRFGELGSGLRAIFLVAVCLGTLTTCLLVAPVASHRILFRQHRKAQLVLGAHRFAQAGLTCLAMTVVCVIVLVFGFVDGMRTGLIAGAVALVVFAVNWLVIPMVFIGRSGTGGPGRA